VAASTLAAQLHGGERGDQERAAAAGADPLVAVGTVPVKAGRLLEVTHLGALFALQLDDSHRCTSRVSLRRCHVGGGESRNFPGVSGTDPSDLGNSDMTCDVRATKIAEGSGRGSEKGARRDPAGALF